MLMIIANNAQKGAKYKMHGGTNQLIGQAVS